MKKLLIKVVKIRPLIPVFLLILLWSSVYTGLIWKYPEVTEAHYEGRTLTGTVKSKVYNEDGSLKYMVIGDILVYPKRGRSLTEAVIGAKISVIGDLSPMEDPMNRGEYDSRFHYAVLGQYFTIWAEKVETISSPQMSLGESILRFRMKCYERLKEVCPFEYATVATLMFADKRGLSEERKTLYKRVGCAHFLVISGLHVSLFGGMLYRLFRRLFGIKPLASFLTLTALIGYGILSGFGVSVVRAVIMFTVRLIADLIKENYDMLNAVMLSAGITLMVNPLMIGDSSFIYSYGTVFAIALYRNSADGLHDNREMKLMSLLRMPVVIMLSMLPVTLYLSHEYSLLSMVVNLILMPLSVPILMLSLGAMIFSLTGVGAVAGVLDFFLAVLLRGFDGICHFLEQIPGTVIWGKPAVWQLVVYYMLMLLFRLLLNKRVGNFFKPAFYCSILCMVTTVFLFHPYMSMLYVGQGECMVIRIGGRRAIMIDGGSTSEEKVYEYRILPFLKEEGIREIDMIVLSHGDEDHVSGVRGLLSDINNTGLKVDMLVCSKAGMNMDDGLVKLVNQASDNDIRVEFLNRGDMVKTGIWHFFCLSPETGREYEDLNAASLVLYGENEKSGFNLILTGDIGEKSEKDITERVDLRHIYLLKVAHHGSKYATGTKFLEKYDFSKAIISAGKNNRYGHPHRETKERLDSAGIEYRVTAEDGEIDIFTE